MLSARPSNLNTVYAIAKYNIKGYTVNCLIFAPVVVFLVVLLPVSAFFRVQKLSHCRFEITFS